MYKIGDKVRILVDFIPNERGSTDVPIRWQENSKKTGTITKVSSLIYDYKVYFDEPTKNGHTDFYFHDYQLELINPRMPAPDFDLEDIELAEMIMEEMR